MSLTAPRNYFGVHSFTPFSRTTGLPYGTMKCLDSSSFSMEGELVELMGGSQKFPWAVEDAALKAELSIKSSEYPDFVYELFLGKAPTSNSAETGGSVTTLTNFKGTSLKSATTGIASVGVKSGSETDLKFGKYLVKVITSTTVDVYFFSDLDIARGTDGTFQDDTLKVTSSNLTITASTPTDIPNFGLQLTGGSGVIGMTVGDTAEFYVRPINSGSMDVTIGGAANQTMPEFGAIVHAQRRGNDEMLELEIFRLKASGLPHQFESMAWSKYEIKAKAFYDSSKDGVFKIRTVKPA